IVANTTVVKVVHFQQLRTAVDAMRTLAGLSAATFTDPVMTPGVTIVKKVHLEEIRTALDQARSALLLPAWTYQDRPLPNFTPTRAVHMTEARGGVK
ncbi:MAG TPA: hypothetical protein VEU30_12475, partial [Thermoanaerobaculia bacterium]|nr:hypothetical protein [Thermoanaerobaculia bacterium]